MLGSSSFVWIVWDDGQWKVVAVIVGCIVGGVGCSVGGIGCGVSISWWKDIGCWEGVICGIIDGIVVFVWV